MGGKRRVEEETGVDGPGVGRALLGDLTSFCEVETEVTLVIWTQVQPASAGEERMWKLCGVDVGTINLVG